MSKKKVMEDKKLDRLFQTELNHVEQLSDVDVQWKKVKKRLNGSKGTLRLFVMLLLPFAIIGCVILYPMLTNSDTNFVDNKIGNSVTSEKYEKPINPIGQTDQLKEITTIEKRETIEEQQFLEKGITENKKIVAKAKSELVGSSPKKYSTKNKTNDANAYEQGVYIENEYLSYAQTKIEKPQIASQNGYGGINETKKINTALKVYQNQELLARVKSLKLMKFFLEDKNDEKPFEIINEWVELDDEYKKRFTLHSHLLKDYTGLSFSDSTNLSTSLRTTWWPVQRVGISMAYYRQNVHRAFGENFTGFPAPSIYGGVEELISGKAKYQQDIFEPGLLIQATKYRDMSIYGFFGIQFSSSKVGDLELLYENIYDPTPQNFVLEENKLSLSSYFIGCSVQLPVYRRLGVEANYKYQMQTKNQAIAWDPFHNVSLGLFCNF